MIMKGNTPTSISGVPKVALSLAMIRSHASATPSAPASTWPFAAQMVGLPSCMIVRNRRGKRSVPKCLCTIGTSAANWSRLPPGREDLLVRGGEHHAAHAVVVARQLERRGEVREELVRERVARIGLIERDGGDAVVAHVVANCLQGHGVELYYARTASQLREARMYDSIVVGIDGSETADIALGRAIELARMTGATLHVVSAYEPTPAHVSGGAPPGEFTAGSDFKADAVLQRALDRAGGEESRSRSSAEGLGSGRDPRRRQGAWSRRDRDRQRRHAGARRVLGSVPNKVSHQASCDVLIVQTR